jgi:hypothetical protein
MRFKIDLRFLVGLDENTLQDAGVAEVARGATQAKYFKDKAKTVITSKCSLNKLLNSMPFLPWKKISSVRIPFIHIMGFDAIIYTFSIKSKQTYTIQQLAAMSYPCNLDHIKEGHIQNVLKSFTLLENTILELESLYNENQSNNDGNAIEAMLASSTKKKKAVIKNWTTEIVWSKDDNKIVGCGGDNYDEE